MNQKAHYTNPEIDLIKLPDSDIITISSFDIEVDPGENDGEWL